MSLTENYYTITQVACHLNVTRQTVHRWCAQRRLRWEKVGREVLILRSDIEKLRCPTCGQVIRKGVPNARN